MDQALDWQTVACTAVISDLHLCEAEPIHPEFPLWKKYKTKEFFFDSIFHDYLAKIEEMAKGQSIELVLNGDIFDFDSVTSLPEKPIYRISWIEKKRGLFPRPERAEYKIEIILAHHPEFFAALRAFIDRGHRAVFVIGNHDVELHFKEVQKKIRAVIQSTPEAGERIRFCEWFYISNKDTLIEHGNQYDPYCICEDPVHPYVRGYNYKAIKLPFGNMACRYILNGMGFFNPHVDTNYIMSVPQYIRFFLKYMVRAQPLLIFSWLWGAFVVMAMVLADRLKPPMKDPLHFEDHVEEIAKKSNASPRMVRELRELFVDPAVRNPFLILRELWLDRALLLLSTFLIVFEIVILINQIYSVSFFWVLIPLALLLPFFLFYSQSIQSLVSSYKEPNDRILATASRITKVLRIIYGHTHHARHELVGAVEHLNSGCWSPAFMDVECTKPIDQKTFVWIEPEPNTTPESVSARRAILCKFENGQVERIKT
jgi:UDP-2,3-diacylglucosamine pyrophosphatase LpxH